MNIAIGRKTFGRNYRFGFGLLIAGLLVAAVSVGVWQATDSGKSRTVAVPVSVPAVSRPIEPATSATTPVYYYLVDTPEQADFIAQADFEAQAHYTGLGTGINHITHVIDVSTAEGEALARALQEDLYVASTQYGFDASLVQVHDLTGGVAAAATDGSSFRPAATPSQATIYIVGSEAERQQLLYEADVAAAFEGAEYVVPTVVVIDASDPEALLLEEAITEDALNGGTGARIIDLR